MLFHLLAGFIGLSQATTLAPPRIAARDLAVPASKDATIFVGNITDCTNCPPTPGPVLQAGTGPSGLYFERALIGFNLPVEASTISECTLFLPGLTTPHTGVTVILSIARSSDWDPETVNAIPPDEGNVIAAQFVNATENIPPLDITTACIVADKNNMMSIYLRTDSSIIEFASQASGNPAILKIQRH